LRLQNAELAIVEETKIVDYLLNAAHPYGAAKARFFTHFGFSRADWRILAAALLKHGQTNEVDRVKETGFGPRYELVGEILVPDGRRPRIRTVWQVDEGQIAPRLITAYPEEQL